MNKKIIHLKFKKLSNRELTIKKILRYRKTINRLAKKCHLLRKEAWFKDTRFQMKNILFRTCYFVNKEK